uniref:Uncharacterized protein n=1 Tax=Arundo donax TaxID=35708 RepID=A0A0A8ZR78_ARUDO
MELLFCADWVMVTGHNHPLIRSLKERHRHGPNLASRQRRGRGQVRERLAWNSHSRIKWEKYL